jgi:subtilisin-like proprotein convertase family protein
MQGRAAHVAARMKRASVISKTGRRNDQRRGCAGSLPRIEPLEGRTLLSGGSPNGFPPGLEQVEARKALAHTNVILEQNGLHPNLGSPASGALTPSLMRHIYGIDQVLFGSIQGDGSGQTIALIDAYDYPTALTDLQTFDAQFGLPDPPSFRRVAQDGSTNYPSTDPAGAGNPNGTWELEESLDVEWSHAIAPAANIILVEANTNSYADLIQNAAGWARNQPGVSAISMSFGGGEFSTETSLDSYLTTPSGHSGITFVASTGDSGKPGEWPSYSPNVLAIGGTSLHPSGSSYGTEDGWSGSGGGISTYESQPSYQKGVVTQSATQRTNPDVAMDADPNTGVAVYDSYDYPSNPWIQLGGTSLSAPMWAGLMAITNQGRALAGRTPLDGPTQTLPTIYSLPAADFHDITTGANGFAAGPGYDLVTGRGSPIANLLIPDLAGDASISGTVYQDTNSNGSIDAGDSPMPGVTVFLDANNNGVLDAGSTTQAVSTNVPRSIPDNNSTGVSSTLVISNATSPVSQLTITFSITHSRDSDLTGYLIGPDGTQVKLFSGLSGVNFTNTTLDDSATTLISSALAPFVGTFRPSSGTLSTFNGKSANGTWTFKVVDSRRSNTGSITAWSLSMGTPAEVSTVTDANGAYSFLVTPGTTYNVREVVPAGFTQNIPAGGGNPAPANVVLASGAVTGQNFLNSIVDPTVFTAAAPGAAFYLTLDPTHTFLQISNGTAPLATPTYQLPLASTSTLTFNLNGTGEALYVDFSNGSPLPAGNLTLNCAAGGGDELRILAAATTPALTMTDTQIGIAGQPAVVYNNVSTLSLFGCNVYYTGSLSSINNLVIGVGAWFDWTM